MLEGGKVFQFGPRAVTFYPLSLKQLRALKNELATISTLNLTSMGDQFDVLVKIFLASAQRGDPSVTVEDVEAVVDMSNLLAVIEACISQKVKHLGEAIGQPSRQTGDISSPVLQTLPAGPTTSLVS